MRVGVQTRVRLTSVLTCPAPHSQGHLVAPAGHQGYRPRGWAYLSPEEFKSQFSKLNVIQVIG